MTGPRNGTGTAALLVALVGLGFCWSVVGGLACGVIAVVLGLLGRGRAARGEANNREIASAGAALGLVAVAASVAFTVVWVYAWQDSGGSRYVDCAVRAGDDQKAVEGCTDRWLKDVEDKFGLTGLRPRQGST